MHPSVSKEQYRSGTVQAEVIKSRDQGPIHRTHPAELHRRFLRGRVLGETRVCVENRLRDVGEVVPLEIREDFVAIRAGVIARVPGVLRCSAAFTTSEHLSR
jgi:hypothetical protein